MAHFPTENYSVLQDRYKSLTGMEVLQAFDENALRENIKKRFRTAFNAYPWPEFRVVGEQLTLVNNTIRTLTPLGVAGGVALANDADQVLAVQKQDPNTNLNPSDYIFAKSEDANNAPSVKIITNSNLVGIVVYVTYKKHFESVIKSMINPAGTTGYFGTQAGDTTDLPSFILEYLCHGAYCDYLKSDGQNQKGIIEEQVSENLLTRAIENVESSGRQHRTNIGLERPTTQFNRHQGRQAQAVTLPGQGRG